MSLSRDRQAGSLIHSARRIALLVMAVLVVAVATIPWTIPLFIYRPAQLRISDPRRWGLPTGREIEFAAPAGPRLTGWWMAPATADRPVVLMAHGRSANIATRAGIARRLVADGFGVLLFDYRGYGASGGRPSERGLIDDTLAAADWLREHGVPSTRVIVLGQSLGNAPAAAVAARRRVAALVLVSPFTSLPQAVADSAPWLPIRMLCWPRNRFDVAAEVGRTTVPIMFVASRNDGLVPFANTLRLAGATGGPVHWLIDDRLRHNGLLAGVAQHGRLSAALTRLVDPQAMPRSAGPKASGNSSDRR